MTQCLLAIVLTMVLSCLSWIRVMPVKSIRPFQCTQARDTFVVVVFILW